MKINFYEVVNKFMEMIDEKDCTFNTDKNIEDVISSLSDTIILDNVKDQINNIEENYSDNLYYLSYFNTKYDYLVNKYNDNKDILDKINSLKESIYTSIKEYIENKFCINIIFPDYITKDMAYNYINIIYKFFVINYQENVYSLITNYIKEEYKNIIKYYKNRINKKDLTYTNLNKNIDKNLAIIICEINNIVENMVIDQPVDIINLVIKDDPNEYYNENIFNLVNLQFISFKDNFVNNILNMIKSNDKLYLNIRTKLLNDGLN